MIGNLIEEIIEAWHKRPIRVIFAFLLIEALLVMMIIAGEPITTYIVGVIALMLFIGGLLLVLSTKPREYKSATWMSGIAFFLLLSSLEGIKTLGISFLSATNILAWTAIAFILLALFEKNHIKKYRYATLAFLYIVFVILSH